MNHYLEIVVLPDPEFTEAVLMNATFSKLHRALVDVGRGEVGVSFPHQAKSLGDCVRLHGTKAALDRLVAINWLAGLRDYVRASGVQPVPEARRYRVVRRVQVKSSVERLRRRSIKKGWLTEEEAVQKIRLLSEKRSKLPFVQIKSNSSGEMFCLFIQQGPLQDVAILGKFNNYGLSGMATVPCF